MSFKTAFKHALSGISHAIKTETHFRFHCLIACCVIVTGIIVQLPARDWLWITLALTSVLSAELINTAIERVTDIASPEYSELGKQAKDCGAGAVLICSLFAVAIGIIIFGKM